jgi:hypothetical protein
MIEKVDRDGNGKISIEGRSFIYFLAQKFTVYFLEFAALVERES